MKNYLLSIVNAVIWFTIGTRLLLINNAYWNTLGIVLYVIGGVIIIVSTWGSMWDKFVEKTTAVQYLLDSARHLDNERLNALLYAMGLKPLKSMPVVQEYKTAITINTIDNTGATTTTRNVYNLPISIEQLTALADALINERAPMSRREMVERRHLLTDAQYRNLQPALEREKIIELKIADNPNAGFKLSDYGASVMREYAPSPTLPTEEVLTPA